MAVLQSPWIIDGQRKGVSSVEERIAAAVLPAFKADRHKFMSAGDAHVLLQYFGIRACFAGPVNCNCKYCETTK